MMVVDIAAGEPSRARPLIDPWPYARSIPVRTYGVAADGRFIAIKVTELTDGDEKKPAWRYQRYQVGELHVVLDFFEELRQRVAD
jgi:hypothetical protein